MKNSKQLTKEDKRILNQVKNRDYKYYDDFYNWNWEKDTSNVDEYFNSYLDSEGFDRIINNQKQWWRKRHPIRKWCLSPDLGTTDWFEEAKDLEPYRYTFDSPYAESQAGYYKNLGQYIIQVDRNDQDFPVNFILGHEYLHGKSPFDDWGQTAKFSPRSAQAEALDQNKNTAPGHDSQQKEKHADIWGLKYLFYKEGIYDSRSNKNITKQQVQKLRKKYPNLRPFQQMNDDMIVFMMNNVALNSTTEQNINYAKFGNKIRFK